VVNSALYIQVDLIVDHKAPAERFANVLEIQFRWTERAEDSWHQPINFEHNQDALVANVHQLPIRQRKALHGALDPNSSERVPEAF
jgi:hypothetical protein